MTSYLRREGKERIPLAPEDKQELREKAFALPVEPCPDCGGLHWGACPRIRRLVLIGEGSATGNRVEVEYWSEWDDSDTVYPQEAWEDDE